jgi:hypothetical protein
MITAEIKLFIWKNREQHPVHRGTQPPTSHQGLNLDNEVK